MLPCEGYAYVQVVHNPGCGTFTNLSTKTVLRDSGQGMMVKLCDVRVDDREGLCLVVMYHSFANNDLEQCAPGSKSTSDSSEERRM